MTVSTLENSANAEREEGGGEEEEEGLDVDERKEQAARTATAVLFIPKRLLPLVNRELSRTTEFHSSQWLQLDQ